ncbi:MAG: PTS sugar transporter subunit IIA [Clostridiales bacterium]|nr:PTS sugar transporter subunit IIA [Clostridiales bacterium]
MSSVLREIVDRGLCRFTDRVPSWQEAVRQSAAPLAEAGYTDGEYYRQIVSCIRQYGPYMVFDHQVALLHAQVNAPGVRKTAVSLLCIREGVDFGADEDGTRKTARLFFTLASCDPDEHMDKIQALAEVFLNEPLLDALTAARSPEDILAAEERYPC